MIASDFHTHAFPPGMVPEPIHRARAASRAARLGRTAPEYVNTVVQRMMSNVDDPMADRLRTDLEAAGFRRAALLGLDWGLVIGDTTEMSAEEELEWVQEVAGRHAGFFLVFFGIDPRRPGAAQLVERALCDERLGGVKLYPPAGFSPLDDRCMPIYEAVVAAGATVVVHTGRQTFPFDIAHGRVEPYGEVQRRYPSLRLVLGHAGWPSWGRQAIEVAAGHPSTWVEISNWNREAASDPERVRRFLRRAWSELGAGRVLFGTDYYAGPRSGDAAILSTWKKFVEEAAIEDGIDLAASESAVDLLFERA